MLEVRQDDGPWTASMRQMLPTDLDNRINNSTALVSKASARASPQTLFESLPVDSTMVHAPDDYPMLAKFPIDEWVSMNPPYTTVA